MTIDQQAVNTIKMLAVDAVEKAKSGHPGMPMGAADMAFVLWSRYLRHDPSDPRWADRDRFVLSAGHGCMLLYALLHLSGYDLPIEEIRNFRQWDSRTPGHPEYGHTVGVETTTGPLGQGFGNGVGMAIAAKMLAARFNGPAFSPVTHRVFGIVSDGDLMEGVSSEAASIAGHLRLGNLVYLYDDNHITIEGETGLAFSEDVAKRFDAYGWHTTRIDGHDRAAVAAALDAAIAETGRPSLVVARTHIGAGAPTKHDSHEAHGAPLGPEEAAATKKALGWPAEPAFLVPDEVRSYFAARAVELKKTRQEWERGLAAWKQAQPDQGASWDAHLSRALPAGLPARLLAAAPKDAAASRVYSGAVIQEIAKAVPQLVGGSADLAPSTSTLIKGSPSVGPGAFEGRNFHWGIREHGMGSILNGMSVHGGWIVFGATFLQFSDYMRPAIRLAALSKIPVTYVYTHDSIFLGEDGPTHQPVEHLTSLRAIPNCVVIRPFDPAETALAWAYALARKDGPTCLILSRQTIPLVPRAAAPAEDLISRGGYTLVEAEGGPARVVLVATGSEVPVAAEARGLLKERGVAARVVSMPSLELFFSQPEAYRRSVLPDGIPRVSVEAGIPDCWWRVVGSHGLPIGIDRFGASAPAKILSEKYGLTGRQVADRIAGWLSP